MKDRVDWLRLVPGLALVFGLFHGAATFLESDRGQSGILVGALVLAATAAVYRFVSRERSDAVFRQLGLGVPRATGMIVASAIAVLLWIAALLFVRAKGLTGSFYPGWLSLVPGLFAQAGIAEEVLFRGYLFGQLRAGRTFWQAAMVSMVPFVGVHLILFLTMPWPIALASVLLSVVISFPLARLFELGGSTIWPPALLHFVIQGTAKVLVFPEGGDSFALAWMAASAAIPLLVFARFRVPRASS
jgi:membrane protease YdiL (CAAX protease family)